MFSAQALVCCLVLHGATRMELVEFTAPWCGACRQMEVTVDRLAAAGIPVRKINVDLHRDWAEKMGIQGLPTFMLVADGKEVSRIKGGTSYQDLVQLAAPIARNAQEEAQQVIRSQSPAPQSPASRFGGALAKLTKFGQRPDSPCNCQGACVCNAGGTHDARQVTLSTPNAAVGIPASLTSPSPARSSTSIDVADRAIANALNSSVRLKIGDPDGFSYGTGTIVDVHDGEALVLTCGHIFRSSQGKGSIMCDLFVGPIPISVPGELVDYDLRRDVGLVSLRPGVPVTAMQIGGAGQVPHEGERVFAVGCDRGADPSVIRNRVLAVNRYHGPANLVVGGRPIDGRSGGGLFNERGALIGVCNAADQVDDEGLYAALGPIHAQLDAVNLGHLYRNKGSHLLASQPAAVRQPAAETHPAAGQNPTTPQPGDALAAVLSPSTAGTMVAPAVFDSTTGNGSGTEVICIVRARGQTGEGNQVLVLEHPSPQLLDQLTREYNRRGPHVNTDLHSPRVGRIATPPAEPALIR